MVSLPARKTCWKHGHAPKILLKDGRYRCSQCTTEQNKRRYANPVSNRRMRIRRAASKYNISVTEYVALWVAQGGKCAICAVPFGDKRPHVDHSHYTFQVRGLLCNSCNLAIGMFKDKIPLLEAAIAYLRKSGPTLK